MSGAVWEMPQEHSRRKNIEQWSDFKVGRTNCVEKTQAISSECLSRISQRTQAISLHNSICQVPQQQWAIWSVVIIFGRLKSLFFGMSSHTTRGLTQNWTRRKHTDFNSYFTFFKAPNIIDATSISTHETYMFHTIVLHFREIQAGNKCRYCCKNHGATINSTKCISPVPEIMSLQSVLVCCAALNCNSKPALWTYNKSPPWFMFQKEQRSNKGPSGFRSGLGEAFCNPSRRRSRVACPLFFLAFSGTIVASLQKPWTWRGKESYTGASAAAQCHGDAPFQGSFSKWHKCYWRKFINEL